MSLRGLPISKRLIPPVVVIASLLFPSAVQAGQYELVRTYGQGSIYRTSAGQSLPPRSIAYDSDINPQEPYEGFPLPIEEVWGDGRLDLIYSETYVIRWMPAAGETMETDPPQPEIWGVDWDSRITWGSTSGMEYSPASMSAYTKAEVAEGSYELNYGFTWTPPGPDDPDGTLVESGDGDGDRIGWLDFEVNGPAVEITVTYTASIVCNGPFFGYISL